MANSTIFTSKVQYPLSIAFTSRDSIVQMAFRNTWEVIRMGCTAAGRFDPDTGRHTCQVTGDDCMFLFPSSRHCAEMFNEGPDADNGDEDDQD